MIFLRLGLTEGHFGCDLRVLLKRTGIDMHGYEFNCQGPMMGISFDMKLRTTI